MSFPLGYSFLNFYSMSAGLWGGKSTIKYQKAASLPTGGVYNCTQVHVPSPSPRLMGPYGAQSGLYITQASIRTPARAPKPWV